MFHGCEGFRAFSRRQFFRIGGAGFFGLTMANLFQARASSPARQARANQMLVIWLGGGPPHQDTFDMKPDAPAEIRGEFRPIQTNVPGMQICELMPELARVADKFTIIRSCGIGNETWEHSGGAYWLTGNPRRPSTPKYPTYGSVVAHLRPSRTEVPSFVALGSIRNHSGDIDQNYLGPQYDPLTFNPVAPNDQVRTMLASPQLDLAEFDRSQDLLQSVNRQLRQQDATDPVIEGMDEFRQRAFDLIRSPRVRQALGLTREPRPIYDRYNVRGFNGGGGSSSGLTLLAARRLLEAGVPFVYAPMGYWDLHGGNFRACREMLPALSRTVAALIEDLDVRGLLDTTIVTVLGEMGRTPRINNAAGRDHWGTTQSVFVAGGGFRGGAIVGATDRHAAYVVDRRYKVESFGRTLYHLLGINPDQELLTTANRPMKIILEDAPLIREALA